METWIEIAKNFGVPVALLAFILWKEWRKEQRENKKEDNLIKRVENMEEFQRTTLTNIVLENSNALTNSTRTLERLIENHDSVRKVLNTRPCLRDTI